MSERLAATVARIDAENAADPSVASGPAGPEPAELLYARRVNAWLERLEPSPSDALRVAVRASHLRRWEVPRSTYPEGRDGYRRWRTDQAQRHADLCGVLLRELGWDEAFVARVESLIQKRHLKTDPEAQALEDAACLVFLEHALPAFRLTHDDDALLPILRKTWAKMSERARNIALTLQLPSADRDLVARALARG